MVQQPQAGPAAWAKAQEAPGLDSLIEALPKAELHVHVEGTLEPELLLRFAQRNGVELPYITVEEARAARSNFSDLQSFLDEFGLGIHVLRTEVDFYELASAYFQRAAAENIKHVELFFDAQAHTSRGVPHTVFMPGLRRALSDAEALGVHARLVMCLARDRGGVDGGAALAGMLPYAGSDVIGLGLDNAEMGNPPRNFWPEYTIAKALGWHRVAHAGEEGPPEYVWEAIMLLGVERVDHGIRSLEDPALVEYMEASRLPITLCPLSNLQLKVYKGQLEHRLRQLVTQTKIQVTINSDDPAYFSGYINANYKWLAKILSLSADQLADLAKTSFNASFISPEAKAVYFKQVDEVLDGWKAAQV